MPCATGGQGLTTVLVLRDESAQNPEVQHFPAVLSTLKQAHVAAHGVRAAMLDDVDSRPPLTGVEAHCRHGEMSVGVVGRSNERPPVAVAKRLSRLGVQEGVGLLLFAVVLSLGSPAPQQNDVRITVARTETASSQPSNPEFVITLENRENKELVMVLGWKIGMRTYPHALIFLLTDPNGRTNTLRYRLPLRIGGRIVPYLLPLSGGHSYTVSVALSQYTSPYTGEGRTRPPASGELDPNLPPGTYTIQAILEKPPSQSINPDVPWPPANLWTGAASSNVLRFSVP